MSLDVTPITGGVQPFQRKPNKTAKPGNGGLTVKVRAMIEAQAFQGLSRKEAAAKAGLTENAAYQALRKPAVLQFWNECLQVLRTGERARNIHRLTEIRDAANNMPAVQAIKALEEFADTRRDQSGQKVTTPGVMIVVNTARERPIDAELEVIEINPGGSNAAD